LQIRKVQGEQGGEGGHMETRRRISVRSGAALVALALFAGCATAPVARQPRTTERDKTVRGAGVGAAAGAVGAVLAGKREADEILAGAAIGAVVGAGVGAYMDSQEEKLARIPGTTVERVGEDTLLVHFDSDVLFPVDSAVMSPGSRSTLDQVATVLNDFDKTAVVVQGHTDARGTEEHNQALSERRAEAVRGYLIGRGVDAGRVVAVGYGASMPAASNGTESGRAQNRRVDVVLKSKSR
jgi:outer membrane protein OmpA-like peptidoglycan-associated protein